MPVVVIHFFKVVNIKHHQTEWFILLRITFHRLMIEDIETFAVKGTRHQVVLSLMQQGLLLACQARNIVQGDQIDLFLPLKRCKLQSEIMNDATAG